MDLKDSSSKLSKYRRTHSSSSLSRTRTNVSTGTLVQSVGGLLYSPSSQNANSFEQPSQLFVLQNFSLLSPPSMYNGITTFFMKSHVSPFKTFLIILSAYFSLFFIAPSYSPYTCSTSANSPAPINNAPITPTMVMGMS